MRSLRCHSLYSGIESLVLSVEDTVEPRRQVAVCPVLLSCVASRREAQGLLSCGRRDSPTSVNQHDTQLEAGLSPTP